MQPLAACSQHEQVGDEDYDGEDQAGERRCHAADDQNADQGDGESHGAAEGNDLAVQPDPAGHDCSQAEQRGEVEHVRAEYDARADALLVTGQSADGPGSAERRHLQLAGARTCGCSLVAGAGALSEGALSAMAMLLSAQNPQAPPLRTTRRPGFPAHLNPV